MINIEMKSDLYYSMLIIYYYIWQDLENVKQGT